jgi:hypothetical protein
MSTIIPNEFVFHPSSPVHAGVAGGKRRRTNPFGILFLVFAVDLERRRDA